MRPILPDYSRQVFTQAWPELDLRPHPEGGWFRETYRSAHSFTPQGYDGPRAAATAIHFALHPGETSRWHVVRSDELWLWHAGGPLELRFGGDGDAPGPATTVTLGMDLAAGHRPQVLVPAGVWQAAEPATEEPVLVSCVVAPGFDFADFTMV
jgi:predicted cupin superfamily sugar epimerase